MLRTLAVGWLLLAVCLLPVAGLLTSQSRAEGMACGEGRCCCEHEPVAKPVAATDGSRSHGKGADGGCCASDASRALPPQLQPACECGGHGGATHVATADVALDLPSARVHLDPDLTPSRWMPGAAIAPDDCRPTPEPPPPRRLG